MIATNVTLSLGLSGVTCLVSVGDLCPVDLRGEVSHGSKVRVDPANEVKNTYVW